MRKKILAALLLFGVFISGPVMVFSQAGGDYIVHTIQRGEVPSVLAKKFNVSLEDLISLNHWGPKLILHVGDKVKLPIGAHLSTTTDNDKATAPKPVVVPPTAAAKPAAEETEGRSAPAPIVVTPVLPKADTGKFMIHILEHGEIPSVLAKKYNLNVDAVKEINNWTPKTVWHVGDKIKLPRSHTITQAVDSVKVVPPAVAKVTTTEVAVAKPLPDTAAKTAAAGQPQGIQGTYIVQKKETLYSIGKRFKVSPEQIRNWNNLPNNNIAEGQSLILYTSQPIVQPELAATKQPAAPVVENPAPSPQPKVVETKPAASTSVPLVAPAVSQKPAAEAVAPPVAEEGYFTPLFGKDVVGKNVQTTSGAAMTFKTASGWADKKYYILMDDVSPGGVVKITNAAGKSLYAKVLWGMGDARDNDGLTFRISDAAASALGIKDAKFNISVSYYK